MLIIDGEPYTSRGVRTVPREGVGNLPLRWQGAFALPYDLLRSETARSMLANSDFVMMLNQAATDRAELEKMFNISSTQLEYITNSDPGQGLLFTGGSIIPFVDDFPRDTKLYKMMTTKLEETGAA